MQFILNTPFQVVQVVGTQRQNQKRRAANVERRIATSDASLQDRTRVTGFANKVGNEHDQLQAGRRRNAFRGPSCAVVNAYLDSTVNSGCDIVGVALCERRGIEWKVRL